VNRHRIAAAKTALRDPKLAHLPVLTIALDSALASLPPSIAPSVAKLASPQRLTEALRCGGAQRQWEDRI